MKKKTELTDVEKFYAASKRAEPVKAIAAVIECEEQLVVEYLATLPQPEPEAQPSVTEAKQRVKTRAENLYGNNGKGAVVCTPAASEYNDAVREKAKLDQSSFIHKIK